MVDVVAANGDGLTGDQIEALQGNEIPAANDPDLHAEASAMEYIQEQKLTPLEGEPTRNPCPVCENAIRDAGGQLDGPASWKQRIAYYDENGDIKWSKYPFGQRSFVFTQGS